MKFMKKHVKPSGVLGSGQALILIFLLVFLFSDQRIYFFTALFIAGHLFLLPSSFRPAAALWLALAAIPHTIVNRVF